MYFNKCSSIEELKELYKKLAMQYHPDRGGDTATMQAINAEYESAFEHLKNIHKTAANGTYTSESTETPREFIEIINAIISLNGITIELIGRWIWITGNTYPHRETLKASHFTYCHNKRAWQYHRPEDNVKTHGRQSLNEIRGKYGATIIKDDNLVLA